MNPRFKAPPDYKPVLKEAKLPIDVSSYLTRGFKSFIKSCICDLMSKSCRIVKPYYLTEARNFCRFVLDMAHTVFLIEF